MLRSTHSYDTCIWPCDLISKRKVTPLNFPNASILLFSNFMSNISNSDSGMRLFPDSVFDKLSKHYKVKFDFILPQIYSSFHRSCPVFRARHHEKKMLKNWRRVLCFIFPINLLSKTDDLEEEIHIQASLISYFTKLLSHK